MTYDFTTVPDRRGTHSLKWDKVQPAARPGLPDVIPLWVADMDFAPHPSIVAALAGRVAHPFYGYTSFPHEYFEAVAAWNARRYGRAWPVGAYIPAPSVLHGLSMAVRALTKPGDRILNLPPVYYPFYKVAQLNDREILDVPLARGARWGLDAVALRRALEASKAEGRPVRALLFSAPQNPTGRVWETQELTLLGELAREFDFYLLSDEIHSDLIQPPHRHQGFLDLPGLAERSLVFAGPNKTFNLAGLPISHIVALDDGLRRRMKRAVEADFYDQPNTLSLAAAWTAYREGEPWLEELLTVIGANFVLLQEFLAAWSRDLALEPPVTAQPLEATYLAWVDATALVQRAGFSDDRDLGDFLETEGRVKLTTGSTFQTGGRHHVRFNLATPASLLQEGLDRMRSCLEPRLGR